MNSSRTRLRPRQMFDKYRIESLLAKGGFADVYAARDTIEGIKVAVKLLHLDPADAPSMEQFRREVRLTAGLDHPNILNIKDARIVDERFMIVYPLGQCTLGDRLQRRMAVRTALDFAQQILEALACAHQRRILHCDVKPENFILFAGNRLRLSDFGIAKVGLHTLAASGSGTLGHMAPEQAMGRPSARSDVFCAGLILYRMFSGRLPEWPYVWPLAGIDRLRRHLSAKMIDLIRRSLEVQAHKRFRSAEPMLEEFCRLRMKAEDPLPAPQKPRKPTPSPSTWREQRVREFQRRYRKTLETVHRCARCSGPVSEPMLSCPWCGHKRRVDRAESRFPATCPRCHRGVKLDWKYCPWCYGPSLGPTSARSFSDLRYSGHCAGADCPRGDLMPFMRYCPWCRRKVTRNWPLDPPADRCPRCKWGVVKDSWETCPWCQSTLKRR